MRRLILTVALLASLRAFSATTNTAAGLSSAQVQSAINACSSGDTALMPSGAGTWSSGVVVPSGVMLRGAGIDATRITDQCGAYNALEIGDNCRATQFTISAAASGYSQRLISAGQAQNFRVDNVVISNVIVRGFVVEGNGTGLHAQGVVDHCRLYAQHQAAPGDGVFQLAMIQGAENNYPPDENTSASSLYYAPGLGSSNAVFFENCLFWQDAQGDASLETYQGAKVVVRFCMMTNFFLGVHGRDSSPRTGHSIEVYGNTNYVSLGTDYLGFIQSRGGTGLVYSNQVFNGSGIGNSITLLSYRSAGVMAVDEPDYTQRFLYHGNQLDGHSKYDGNTAVSQGSGTHNGANGASTLTDSTKSWGADAFKGNGTYASTDNLQTYFLWNRTDGSGGRITASSATTVTATLSGGTRNNWNSGDTYVITFGYPGLDQNGWSGPTRFIGTYSTQTLSPWYQWQNTLNGSAGIAISVGYLDSDHTTYAQPQSDLFIQENREYYNDTAKPGYSPFTYPHPLVGGAAEPGPLPPASGYKVNVLRIGR